MILLVLSLTVMEIRIIVKLIRMLQIILIKLFNNKMMMFQ